MTDIEVMQDEKKKRKALKALKATSDDDAEESTDVNCKKQKMEGQEYDDLLKRLKEKKERNKLIPHFKLKSIGEDASIGDKKDETRPLCMRDLQGLLLYALLGTKAPVEPSRWCKFERWNKITHINCLVIDGVGTGDLIESEKFSSVMEIFPNRLEFISPLKYNSSIVDDLSVLPLSVKMQKEIKKYFGSHRKGIQGGVAFKIVKNLSKAKVEAETYQPAKTIESDLKLKLMLSLSQMIDENYPLHIINGVLNTKTSEYVFSKDEYTEVTANSPLYAVDCEMCLTNTGRLELTKVCVVDSDLNEVFHSFVKPRNPITDYLTRYSGITAAMLQDVETRLEDVQEALRRLLPPDAIWIGQSLNGDLRALQMVHPYVIDTSVIFNITGVPGRKTKLKILSELFLGEKIQNKGSDGHDPKEDAIAAM